MAIYSVHRSQMVYAATEVEAETEAEARSIANTDDGDLYWEEYAVDSYTIIEAHERGAY